MILCTHACPCCTRPLCSFQSFLPADARRTPVLAVELLGNRFLRRMVRVLVATVVREAVPQGAVFGPTCGTQAAAAAAGQAAAGRSASGLQRQGLEPGCTGASSAPADEAANHKQEADWDAGALLRAVAAGDRSLTAPAAPAEGLCFLEAGYWPLHA